MYNDVSKKQNKGEKDDKKDKLFHDGGQQEGERVERTVVL